MDALRSSRDSSQASAKPAGAGPRDATRGGVNAPALPVQRGYRVGDDRFARLVGAVGAYAVALGGFAADDSDAGVPLGAAMKTAGTELGKDLPAAGRYKTTIHFWHWTPCRGHACAVPGQHCAWGGRHGHVAAARTRLLDRYGGRRSRPGMRHVRRTVSRQRRRRFDAGDQRLPSAGALNDSGARRIISRYGAGRW
jgi:hypothetical protein